jgi:CRISPR system Cascade subunit CasE
VFLTKLTLNIRSRAVLRDVTNVHDMHRTLMSAYPETANGIQPRQHHGVLWRLDPAPGGFVQYVQSVTEPDWTRLPAEHLLQPAQVRPFQPVLDAAQPGRKFTFRLLANPTKCVPHPTRVGIRKRIPLTTADSQLDWLIRQGERYGFVVPTTRTGEPDVVTADVPPLTGRKDPTGKITIQPVQYDGHLIITDTDAFTTALTTGIGRAKPYGCGLLSLAPATTPTRTE